MHTYQSARAIVLVTYAVGCGVGVVERASAEDGEVPFSHVTIDSNPPDRPYYKLHGDVDVAIAEMHQGADPDEMSVLLNGGKGETWKKQVLAERGSHDIVVADPDGDGDLDIIGANHAGVHPLEMWRNDSKR